LARVRLPLAGVPDCKAEPKIRYKGNDDDDDGMMDDDADKNDDELLR
jgi:hypothetical protein